mmetsp:Transcript_6237/g.19081  ORF Transcript_6237/g.19081 Transcript_6237/m.19081 type:complete len:321 (-) Transcript_6237:741-1703(-)
MNTGVRNTEASASISSRSPKTPSVAIRSRYIRRASAPPIRLLSSTLSVWQPEKVTLGACLSVEPLPAARRRRKAVVDASFEPEHNASAMAASIRSPTPPTALPTLRAVSRMQDASCASSRARAPRSVAIAASRNERAVCVATLVSWRPLPMPERFKKAAAHAKRQLPSRATSMRRSPASSSASAYPASDNLCLSFASSPRNDRANSSAAEATSRNLDISRLFSRLGAIWRNTFRSDRIQPSLRDNERTDDAMEEFSRSLPPAGPPSPALTLPAAHPSMSCCVSSCRRKSSDCNSDCMRASSALEKTAGPPCRRGDDVEES